MLVFLPAIMTGQLQHHVNWKELSSIPDKEGFAGMFAGVSNGSLICMGGANFPDKMPWEGGKKIWYDNIYILEKGAASWRLAKEKLPHPIAYGVSFTYKEKIILAGGNDSSRHYAEVITVTYNKGKLIIDSLPSLPMPLANMAGSLVEDNLLIAGGTTSATGQPVNSFLAYNLLNNNKEGKWVSLITWPGPARMQAISASLRNNFFLFSGIDLIENSTGGTDRLILKDAYKYVPGKVNFANGNWVKLSDMPRGVAAGASPAPTLGSDRILFPGGLDSATAKHKDPSTFPGFVTDLLAYDLNSNTFLNFGDLPHNSTRVTVPAAKWNGQWVIINGEIGPGKRSPKVFAISGSVMSTLK
ncbi:MAG: galactose oxidase [Chitinophagaceae bacterium]